MIYGIDPVLDQVIVTGMKMRVEERWQTAAEIINLLRGSSVIPKLIPVPYLSSRGEFLLDKNRLIVGRIGLDEPESVDINLSCFSGANTVSGKHAGIYQEAGEWNVIDLGSTNGTFIKRTGEQRFSKRITAPEILNSGMRLPLAKFAFDLRTNKI